MDRTCLWKPKSDQIDKSEMTLFMKDLSSFCGEDFKNYTEFHQYSVKHAGTFWEFLINYYKVKYEGSLDPQCTDLSFNTYGWFKNVQLNFAQNLLAKGSSESIALNFVHESGLNKKISYQSLRLQTAQLQKSLECFIKKGDVLAAYMPNIPETVVSMLAVTSLGGVFTSTSSDFGVEGVVDRFGQSRPKVLVAAASYMYNGKSFCQLEKIRKVAQELDFIEKIIVVDFLGSGADISKIKNSVLWDDFLNLETLESDLSYTPVNFSDPLYIMYSSGTTGKPKCIVHCVGGVLLQHIKELGLHSNFNQTKNIMFFTTCGWMMWNWLVSSLYFGGTITLYEGSPSFPSLGDFFEIIDREEINIFGTSPKFLKALEDSGYACKLSLNHLESILSTGAPLLPEQYDFVYQKLKADVCLSSISGGTDIIGCFMLGNPILPVYRGEIQCLGLGMDVKCLNDKGQIQTNVEGELVCASSFPSRPIYFLNDENDKKLNEAYFDKYPGFWHHGDFVLVREDGAVIVYGRSDATLNPGGVRIGTAEIYRQTEVFPWVVDSLCVGKSCDGDVDVVLFVKLQEGVSLTDEKIDLLKKSIRSNTTPRHVPRFVHAIQDIPYTRSGKKMELAVSRILNKRELSNIEAVANPECLEEYKKFS